MAEKLTEQDWKDVAIIRINLAKAAKGEPYLAGDWRYDCDLLATALVEVQAERDTLRLEFIQAIPKCSTDVTDFQMARLAAQGWKIRAEQAEAALAKEKEQIRVLREALSEIVDIVDNSWLTSEGRYWQIEEVVAKVRPLAAQPDAGVGHHERCDCYLCNRERAERARERSTPLAPDAGQGEGKR